MVTHLEEGGEGIGGVRLGSTLLEVLEELVGDLLPLQLLQCLLLQLQLEGPLLLLNDLLLLLTLLFRQFLLQQLLLPLLHLQLPLEFLLLLDHLDEALLQSLRVLLSDLRAGCEVGLSIPYG